MYEFLTGPALWMTFIIFFGGLAVRAAYLFGLSREKDRVLYNHWNLGWALRSIGHWLVPLGSVSLRQQPIFGLVVFIFHVLIVGVPLFLCAHNVLWHESLGISLWSMPESWADICTIIVMLCVGFLFIRRLVRPEVRILTDAWDYVLLALTLLPFLTGFLAYHQSGPYQPMLILHILSAEILLILIPLTKLAHAILFFFSRAAVGVEMGARRGARTW